MKKKNIKKNKSVRLTSHVTPECYILTLKPDLEAFTFSGTEVINITLSKPQKEITLHSKDINIKTADIIQGKTLYYVDNVTYDIKSETATIIFKKPITRGKAKLTLTFEGVISDSLRGFYRSRYVIGGETKYLATTQFEATDARRAFPCFDEPAQKAVFDVSLIIPSTHTAISNTMPTNIEEHEAGYKVVTFGSTPRMSTYLLAFIIGEFEFVEGLSKDNVQVRVFTTKGKVHQAKFALKVAIKSLEFYNEYFDIPYPLPVLDLIAIPDFESAAMENWGAITFRESALLVDEEHTSFSNKQWIAIVIAHEIAHQWFGNLVTMHWWTDLWLNEGFASYMENLCVHHIFPEWKIWDLYLADRYAVALELDALANSHPIEVEVHHPDEIGEIFDMVSYAKGSAVIRQLAEYLGYETFRDGLRHYLKKHSYSNTKTVDLWHSFEKVSGKSIAPMMATWTTKTGYPLLSVEQKKDKYIATQERFFSSRISRKKNRGALWQIPIAYQSDSKIKKDLVVKKTFPLLGISIGKVNKDESSFMRVRYDKTTLDRLKVELTTGTLSVRDRLGLVRDLFALAESGYIKTTEALEFALAYKDEREYIVWSEIAAGLARVYNIIAHESFKEKYRAYARDLYASLVEEVGWNKKKDEDYSYPFLRSLALWQSAFYGNQTVIKEGKKLFSNIKKTSLSPDIRSVVYNIVTSNGSLKEWKQFQNLYKAEELHEEKERYGAALARFKDKALLDRTLSFALSSNVRTQDAPFLIARVWQNTNGREITWKFIKRNWKVIMRKYGEGGHFIGRLLSPLGAHTNIKDALDAKQFFKRNNAPGAERTLEQAYERIYSSAAWLKADKTSIKNWLDENFPSPYQGEG